VTVVIGFDDVMDFDVICDVVNDNAVCDILCCRNYVL